MKNITRLLGLFLLAVLFLVSLPAFAYNMTDGSVRSPRPTLPPTMTPIATAVSQQQPTVASIVLIADGDLYTTAVYETVVEWQDEDGNWRVVEGWQSPFNEYKQVTWAVAANNFGKGPFRWIIYQNKVALNTSSNFYLPRSNDEVVTLHVDVP